jgi:hypothetical protein
MHELWRTEFFPATHWLSSASAAITPMVRKAARLAELMGDMEHRVLFDLHLDGFDPSGSSGTRVQPWPDPNVQPKWNVVGAALDDRAEPEGRQGLPLEQLETLVQRMREEQAKAPPDVTYAIRARLLAPEMAHAQVLTRIRNRVANFVRLRLRSKFKMRYGPHTALVIGDSSGVDWDLEIPDVRRELGSEANPFDEGVWILNRTKDRLFQLG